MFSSKITSDKNLNTKIIILSYSEQNNPGRNLSISIAPEFGSNMFSFKIGNFDLIYCDKELLKDRDWTGCFVLWPLPNRVRGKQYEFEDNVISLKDIKRKKGNDVLIHGLVDDKVWKYDLPEVADDHVSFNTHIFLTPDLQKYFPYEGKLTLQYTLNKNGVRIDYIVENNGESNLPFGFALHPYFSTLSGLSDTKISVPAQSVMSADNDLLPTGELTDVTDTELDLRPALSVENLQLDHVFTDLKSNVPAYIDYQSQRFRLNISASSDFTHLVVYTMEKEKGFICLENQTGSIDMINLHTKAVRTNNKILKKAAHLLILPPHQSHSGYIEYTLECY